MVEEALAQAANLLGVLFVGAAELLPGAAMGGIRVTHAFGQSSEAGWVIGKGETGYILLKLEVVFEVPEENVGLGQSGAFLFAQITSGLKGVQGFQGANLADPRVLKAMDELQELDGEFNVANAAITLLDVGLFCALGNGALFEAAFGFSNGGDGSEVELLTISDSFGQGFKPPSQFGVASDEAGFEQGLSLPGFAPGLVVGKVAVEGADQGAGTAFGAEASVHAKGAAFFGKVADVGEKATGEAFEEFTIGKGLLVGLRGMSLAVAVIYEKDIYIGVVVEFAAA